MNIGSIDINKLLGREVNRAVEKILESYLNSDENSEERRKQKEIESQTKARGAIKQKGKKQEVEEAEEETEDKPTEKEEEKAEEPSDKEEKREDRTGGKGTADSQKASTPSQKAISNPKLSSFVDKLNVLRGGKSLKDPEVKNSIDKYLNSLNIKEKQALLIFLTGLSQIMVGKKSGSEALDPAELGIRMKASKEELDDPSEKEKPETGSAGLPIVVGESRKKITRAAMKAYENVKNFK